MDKPHVSLFCILISSLNDYNITDSNENEIIIDCLSQDMYKFTANNCELVKLPEKCQDFKLNLDLKNRLHDLLIEYYSDLSNLGKKFFPEYYEVCNIIENNKTMSDKYCWLGHAVLENIGNNKFIWHY